MILAVVLVVLLVLWPILGCYHTYDPARPYLMGNTLLPWICMCILTWIVLNGLPGPPLRWDCQPPIRTGVTVLYEFGMVERSASRGIPERRHKFDCVGLERRCFLGPKGKGTES